jgi:Ca2+-binding RTX toxin-like protein
MAIFNGTAGNDTVTPALISAGVVADPAGSNLTGNDVIRGFAGNDVVEGDAGNDVASLGSGNDRFIWNPGDGDDTFHGGTGTDTLEFNGFDGVDTMTVTTLPNGGFRFFRDPGDITVDTTGVERIDVNALDGNDTIDARLQTNPLVRLSVDAGAGNDTIWGGAGHDDIEGGVGDDFAWDPGDGDDTFNGGGGIDTLDFEGSGAAERMAVTTLSNGGFRFSRDVGGITIDTTGVERVEVRALGGNDIIDGSAQTRTQVRLQIWGGAGSDTMISGAGGDTFLFGSERRNGTTETDTIRGYDESEGDVVNLRGTGGIAEVDVVGGNLVLTLAGSDHDRIVIRGVNQLSDVDFLL